MGTKKQRFDRGYRDPQPRPQPSLMYVGYARITHKETYFRAEYVPTWTFGLCARRCGSYATPAQGRITHKYVIQDYVPARFKGGLRSKPPSHTRKSEKEPRPNLFGQVTDQPTNKRTKPNDTRPFLRARLIQFQFKLSYFGLGWCNQDQV